MNLVQSSQILSIFFLRIFPSSFKQVFFLSLFSKNISIHWWFQQLSSNFKPQLHFQNYWKYCCLPDSILLSSNSLSSSFQSACRIFHSTETTLHKIHNVLILAMDRGEVTTLILFDLSAAFDTVDHSILLNRLQNWFGLDGLSLDWFSSYYILLYLSSRSQTVSVILYSSLWHTSRFSTWPTCSFSLSIHLHLARGSKKNHPLSCVRWWHPAALYISHTPKNSALYLETLTTTFNDILSLMILNKLHLNPSITEFLTIGPKHQRLKFSDLTNLSICNDIIPVSSSWLHLWLWHVFLWSNQLSISCYFHICCIRRIHHPLPLSTATALTNSLVSS